MPQSEIRKNYLLDQYVIITPGRAKRPRDFKIKKEILVEKSCQFCPENIAKENIVDFIGDQKAWKALSLKNIFPAVSLDNPKAYGAQEVIIDTPEHNKKPADLSIAQIERLLEIFAKRTKALSKNKKLEYILCFKNQGFKAGASVAHAHSQIFATQILPPRVKEELIAAADYREKNKTCAYCDILKKELNSKRKIWEDNFVGAFAPYASEYHYEAWIFAKRHLDNITSLNKQELNSFAKALKYILAKLQELDLDFNFFLHQVVSDNGQHFYLKIEPRDSIWAGVELGSGMIINSVSPEDAAKFYRK